MATTEEIYQAIRNADKAGDTEAVQKLGAYLKTMQAQPQQQAPSKQEASPLDAPNAVATGYNLSLAGLAGLPVDTIMNVVDLGKAAIGAPVTALTGKTPEILNVNSDRSGIVGSRDWILSQARKTGVGRAIVDPMNPEYEGGYLQAAGGGLAAVMNPSSRAQLVDQIVSGPTANMLSKAAYDAMDALGFSDSAKNAASVTASFSPTLAKQGVTSATKYAIRGGEQGRKQMEQRVQDLRNAGIDQPTLGLASGNETIGGVENILQSTPGAVKVMRQARDKTIAALQEKTQQAAEASSPDRGALESGQAIQSGIREFRDKFKARQSGLYDRLDRFIRPNAPTSAANTQNALAILNEDIPGAPELSKLFKNGRIQGIEAALNEDLQRQAPYYTPSQMREAAASQDAMSQVDARLGKGTIPFEAVKKTRTLVGNEIADTNLVSSVPRSKWNPLYGALSNDMQMAANEAGPGATNALDRANRYSRAGMERIDRVQPFVKPDAPEKSFSLLSKTLGGNASTLQAVKKTLPEGARGTIAGTVIEDLGKASPGQQNAGGDVWSPETFLTNWNKISPKARQELFSGFKNSAQVAADVEAVAKATSMMRDSSKMWANPSGTAANLGARAALTAIGGGFFLDPTLAAAAGGGVLSANMLARALTSKGAVEASTRNNMLSQSTQAANARVLSTSEDRKNK